MMLLKKEEEYEKALEDAKKIKEIEPSFSNIDPTLAELE